MIGCDYCRKQRHFWSWDADGSTEQLGKQHTAHIIAGTNIFSDTAGSQMNFRFCPMCGKPLLYPPDDGGGKSGVFAAIFPQKCCNSTMKEKRSVYLTWLTSVAKAAITG